MVWRKIFGTAAALFFLWGWAPAQGAVDSSSEYLSHIVKRGESVSLICIRTYGFWDAALASAVQKLNPRLQDLNKIEVRDTLKLKNPDFKSAKAEPLYVGRLHAAQAVVTWCEGDAFVKAGATLAPQKLLCNAVVLPGATITTGARGRAELVIAGESIFRLKENTQLTIEAIADSAGARHSKTRLSARLGTIWSKVRKYSDRVNRFELATPVAVAAVHGTEYQTSVTADSAAEVKVYSGEVAVNGRRRSQDSPGGLTAEVPGPEEVAGPQEVSMEAWTEIVRDMQRVRIGKDGKPQPVESFTKNSNDAWEQWNQSRNESDRGLVGEDRP